MRPLILLLLICVGCSSVHELNRNMENTNDLMVQNTKQMQESRDVIAANTIEITKSSELMQKAQVGAPVLAGGVFTVMLVPILVLFRLYRKLEKRIGPPQ